MNEFNFSDKKVIVTGASSGLGRSIAINLAESGAIVILIGRNESELIKTKEMMQGKDHIIIPADLAAEGDYSSIFDKMIQDGKKIDGLVHCAGIIPLTPLNTLKKDKIEQCMAINFYALIELTRCAVKKKYRGKNLSIVEISSISSQYPGKCQTLYASSKAAANIAVKSLAFELAKSGARINSLLPGIINTPATQEAINRIGKEIHDQTLNKQIHGLIEMEEIANVVKFLLSDYSSAITGRTIYADGGYIN